MDIHDRFIFDTIAVIFDRMIIVTNYEETVHNETKLKYN